ncbi:MAG: hypothetical protein RIR33_611 [Pseudomonadota bacterium]|jgi:SlyX protein
MSNPEARIDALEIRIAHQDRVIEDLNQTITQQWKDIDGLKREVARFAERMANAEHALGADLGEEPPPPHW